MLFIGVIATLLASFVTSFDIHPLTIVSFNFADRAVPLLAAHLLWPPDAGSRHCLHNSLWVRALWLPPSWPITTIVLTSWQKPSSLCCFAIFHPGWQGSWSYNGISDYQPPLCFLMMLVHLHHFLFFFFFNIYLFIWLSQVLVVACRIFSCGMWGLVPWPRIELQPPALGALSPVTGPPGKSLHNFFLTNLVNGWSFSFSQETYSLGFFLALYSTSKLARPLLWDFQAELPPLGWAIISSLPPGTILAECSHRLNPRAINPYSGREFLEPYTPSLSNSLFCSLDLAPFESSPMCSLQLLWVGSLSC